MYAKSQNLLNESLRGSDEGMSNGACSYRLSWSDNLPPWNKCHIFMRARIRERAWECIRVVFFCFFPAENKEDDGENLRWLKVTHLPISFSPPVAESLPHTILVSRVTEHNKLTFKWPSGGCEEGGRWRGKQDEEEDDDGEDVEESGMR